MAAVVGVVAGVVWVSADERGGVGQPQEWEWGVGCLGGPGRDYLHTAGT